MYLGAPIQELYPGTTITISHGTADITVPLREEYYHAAQATHGSVYFRLLDDAAFFAVSSLVEDVFVLTTSFNIQLLRPVSKGIIKSTGMVFHEGKSWFGASSELRNEAGKLLATGTGSFVKSNIELDAKLGYEKKH